MSAQSSAWSARIDEADVVAEPLAIVATPYIWHDPSTLPLRQRIYGNSLMRGQLSLLVAPGAAGKTAFTAATALALVTGRDLLGYPVIGGAKRVWLWNLEDSLQELAKLIQAAAKQYLVEPDHIADRLYCDSGMDGAELLLAVHDRAGVQLQTIVANALVAELQNRGIDVLIVDPFVSSHRVPENDNGAIDAVAKLWARIACDAGCAVLLVHHTSKLQQGIDATAMSARGASALVNAARSVVTINKMTEKEAGDFGIALGEHRRYFRTIDDKNNRAPPSEKSDWFFLTSVDLGNGTNAYNGDNLPVVTKWTPPDAFDGISVADLRKVQCAVADGEWRQSPQAKDWVGIAVADCLGMDVEKKAEKKRISVMLAEWIKNGALAIEQRLDSSRQMRPFVIVGKPVTA